MNKEEADANRMLLIYTYICVNPHATIGEIARHFGLDLLETAEIISEIIDNTDWRMLLKRSELK